MKKGLFSIFILFCSILVACSSDLDSNESRDDMANISVDEESASEMADFGSELYSVENDQQDIEQKEEYNETNNKEISNQVERKVIYTADLHIEVKNYQKTVNDIQNQVSKFNGYIVDSSMYEDQENESKHGQITVRIPQEKFQEFIKLVEEGSYKVLESSTSGQDVTEEYIDLESRLKSKRVVEERLISFMEQAEKTEDLLKISSDLAEVQEQIEEITGRMKYLQNKSDLATVSIYIEENKVEFSGTGKDNLNTWDQTKQQFMKSINFLITAFSSFFIFFVGNLPVFILIGIIILVVIFSIKRRKGRQQKEN